MKRLLNLIAGGNNLGDAMSAAGRYFRFPGYDVTIGDICHPHDARDVIIVGGGGLLFHRFLPHIHRLSLAKPCMLIGWGLGQQQYGVNRARADVFPYGPYLEGFDLCGVRDFGVALRFVPCASCMHPAFEKRTLPRRPYVQYSHEKYVINFPGIPRMTHTAARLDDVLDFLSSGEAILTSSYHGAYWGALLGRKVIVFPFSSKFFTLKYPVTIVNETAWVEPNAATLAVSSHPQCRRMVSSKLNLDDLVATCRTNPAALDDARAISHAFYREVAAII